MKATKAGIWMDHHHAYVIEFTTEALKSKTIESPHKGSRKPNLQFGETRMHATEQRDESAYYKELSALIRGYKEVILFGPSTAKTELVNLLHENHILRDVDVKTVQADKLTLRQMNAFVRKYFAEAK